MWVKADQTWQILTHTSVRKAYADEPNMTQWEDQVCDTYLFYRRRGHSRAGSIYLTQREMVMSRAAVIDILSTYIRPW